LVVSEISYHPAAPHPDTEFVELLNTGTTALDLAGASFTDGIEFTFAADAVLQPGARTIVVGNLAAFQALYGTNRPVTGEFANGSGLSNLGERIRLEGVDGSVLIDFTYGTGFPWPSMADGFGRTMVLVDPALPADPRSWRPSASAFGNPGTSDSIIRPAGRSLIDHLLAERSPRFDRATSRISVRRRLGSDAIAFQPEWSADCVTWSPAPAVLVAETPDDYGNSTMEWELDNSPADQRLFFRVRVGQ
jgi:hypothetical protein